MYEILFERSGREIPLR